MPTSIGDKIRAIRIRKAWSQETLADKARLKPLTLRDIEHGHRVPRFQTIRKLALALDIAPEELTAATGFEPLASVDVRPLAGCRSLEAEPDDLVVRLHWADLLRVFVRIQNLLGSK